MASAGAPTSAFMPTKRVALSAQKYKKRFPGIMGLVYTGNGYDNTYYLKKAWETVGDPGKFKEVYDYIRTNPYRGVCGYYDMNNQYQEAVHFPDNGYGNQADRTRKGDCAALRSKSECRAQDHLAE